MALFTALQAQVNYLVSADNDELAQNARDAQIFAAVERFGGDVPYTHTDDVTGDAGRYYGIAASLATFVEGFSRVTAIEYPAADITADETPQYLEPEDWRDDYYKTVSGTRTRYLLLPHHTPAATETMRITFTVPYAWTASATTGGTVTQTAHGFSANDYIYENGGTWYEATASNLGTHKVATVPTADTFTAYIMQVDIGPSAFHAVCYMAAGLVCQVLATKYASIGDSTIGADSTAHSSKSAEYAQRARDFMKHYAALIGTDKDDAPPAPSARFINWDTAPGGSRARQWIFHNDR